MEPSSASVRRKRSVVVRPPKVYASLRTVGVPNARPRRRLIRHKSATIGAKPQQCYTPSIPDFNLTFGDTASSATSKNATKIAKRAKRALSEQWKAISEDQIDAYARQLWSSSETSSLCHECWRELKGEVHQCIWQLKVDSVHDVYPLKGSSVDMTLDLLLPEEHMHECSHTHSIRRFSVFDQKARLRQCRVQICDGEEVAVSLIRHHLWPSTPSHPVKAIHISLMEQLYEFVIGSHVSLYRSCQAMQAFANLHTTNGGLQKLDLYLAANRFLSFRFFRRLAQKIFNLRDVLPESNSEPICEACPKNSEDGELFICMDACFGLVHKLKSKNPSSSEAEASRFLCNSADVQEFVQLASKSKNQIDPNSTAVVDCSSFSAGDSVIAATKNKGLSVKGVFGASCRHQQPVRFLDMQHGERFSYPSFLLRNLRLENEDVKTTVIYDVACKFEKYFLRTEPTLSADLTFKVPVFHSYAHSLACQLAFNPRISGSCGLCDGEGQERLWSVLQQSSKCMKEKSASELTKLQGEENGTIGTLEGIERRHGISERWQCDDILFRAVQDQLRMEQLTLILQCMFKAAAELRQFLDLMKKFCPGQDASNRIKRLVKQCRRSLQSNLRKYNQAPKPQTPHLPDSLQEEQVFDPDSSDWAYIHLVTNCGDIDPLISLKLAAIQANGRYKSAVVERNLLRTDLKNIRRCLSDKIAVLTQHVTGDRRQLVKYPLFLSHLNVLKQRLETVSNAFDIEESTSDDDCSQSSSDSDSEYEL